ncbi:MAG: YlxR family protein [Saccharofermentanales bacterium]
MCLYCRRRSSKDELFRLVRSKDGNLIWDRSGKEQKRGYYLCKQLACVQGIAQSRKAAVKLKREVQEQLTACLERQDGSEESAENWDG